MKIKDLVRKEQSKRIIKIIEKHPGILCVVEVGRKLGIGEKKIVYYIDDLEKKGFIETRLAGQKKYCYPKGMAPKTLLAPSTQKMFDVIKKEPGVSMGDAVRKAEVSKNGSRYVAKLEMAGLVYVKKEGSKKCVFPFSYQNAAGVASPKETLLLSREEINILMTSGNSIEEIINNSKIGGGYINIRLNSAFKKLGVNTIQEARTLVFSNSNLV